MIGFGIMLFICKTDYSRIFQHSGILAILYLVFLILQDMQFVRLFSNAVTIPYLLSIPIFCGLLYKFRKRSWYHLLIPVGFMLASIQLMRCQWFFASYNRFTNTLELRSWHSDTFLTGTVQISKSVPTVCFCPHFQLDLSVFR